MKVAPQRRRKQSKANSLPQASNVVDLRTWASDHGRGDTVSQFDTIERQRRFDADMAELETLEEQIFRVNS